MPKHILLMPTNYPNKLCQISGVFFKSQALSLHDAGYRVGVLSFVGLSLIDWLSSDFKKNDKPFVVYQLLFFSIPKLRKFNYWVRTELTKYLLKKYIKKYGLPDIIHVHVYSAAGAAIWAKKNYSIPYVITEHYSSFAANTLTKSQLKQAEVAYKNAYKCLAVSQSLSQTLNKLFHIPFVVVPNVVDDIFSYAQPLHHNIFGKYILNVASLVSIKRHDRLIKAFALIAIKKTDLNLVIAGNGKLRDKLQTLAEELNLTERIHFIGNIDKHRVCQLMQQAEAFVLTSDYETFGVVLIEALSCGTPVVATNVGGMPEIISSNDLGYLCEPDTKIFAQNIMKSLEKKYKKCEIATQTQEKYGKTALVTRLKEIYNSF